MSVDLLDQRVLNELPAHAWVAKYLKPHLFPRAEVLCAGCGAGDLLRVSVETYPTINGTGVDINPLRIQEATKKNHRNSRLRFFRCDVRNLQFPPASFDVAYGRMLLQYVSDKERAVSEMVRVCKPGGVVLLQDLDGQLVWHDPEDPLMQQTIERVMGCLAETGFDPFVGRKLFWLARNAELENIRVRVEPYHLFAGELDRSIFEQWELKLEIARPRLEEALASKYEAAEEIRRYLNYLRGPDALTYSNVFTVTGEKRK